MVDPALLRVAAGLFSGWLLLLAALAFWTANPPQLNFAQLGRATEIVEAEVSDFAGGRCRVVRRWTPGATDEVVVSNLSQSAARSGQSYIMPLSRDMIGEAGSYRIVEIKERGIPPLVYPPTPEVEQQLLRWQQPGG